MRVSNNYTHVAALAGVALARAGISAAPLIPLALAELFLVGAPSRFRGSIAFGCFLLAATWLEFVALRLARRQRVVV